MSQTLDTLAKRVEELEHEVASLRALMQPNGQAQAAISAAWAGALKEMGISGTAIGAEKLQEVMIERGINPQANEFSREVAAMREE